MNHALLKSTAVSPRPQPATYSPTEVFFCPEESQFYAQCLERLLFNRCRQLEHVVEFGAGDGSPVIQALLQSKFAGTVHGYELNPAACEVARSRIQQYALGTRYVVHNQCFFAGLTEHPEASLVANPPYIPAPDAEICLPALHGGVDGATITKRLLAVNCDRVLLMISAYSNPIDTIDYALSQNYRVVDFCVTPLPFGYYSSEPKVRRWIAELRQDRKAFYSPNIYFLAGVLFQKNHLPGQDLSMELLKVMTVL